MSDEYGGNFITLTDEDGHEIELEHLDTIEFNGSVYMAFFPAEYADENGQPPADEEEEAGLIILKVIHDEDGEELLSTCDSEEELEDAYAAFMEDLLEDEEEKDDEEPIFLSVTAEDGEELTLEFVSVFEVNGQEYRAFFPAEEEEEE